MKKKTDEIADNWFHFLFFLFTLAEQLFHIAEAFQSS